MKHSIKCIDSYQSAQGQLASSCRQVSFAAKSAVVLGVYTILSCTASASSTPSISSICNDYDSDWIHGIKSNYKSDYNYDFIPWRHSSLSLQNIDEALRYENMPPNVFSPTGRLHPVEAAVRASNAITPLSNLLVAMRCCDGLMVISTLPMSPHLDAGNADLAASSKETCADGGGIECSHYNSDIFSKTSTPSALTAYDIDKNENYMYPSLFLFDETSTSTLTSPIFDIHPCMIGATAGNAVDNHILRTKLVALGMNTLENQGAFDEEIVVGQLAKGLANQLQMVTQDIATTQKHKLGRLLASSAVVLGSQKIWRIDPTGQFWDCQAAVLGEDAKRIEKELYRRLSQECQKNQFDEVRELLDSLSQKKALALIEDFLENQIFNNQNLYSLQPYATKLPHSDVRSRMKKSDNSPDPNRSSQIYWHAAILDYSSRIRRGTPRRKVKWGMFGLKNEI